MCNKKSIKEIKYNTKKKTTSYKEQCKEKVNKYLNEIKNFSEEDIVYIDETGIQGYIYREYARAIRGKKVYDKIPGKKYKRTNIVAGKCGDKIISPLVYDKIMDSKFFEKWFKEMFLNEVEKNKAIVMDNATFHCKSRLYELCKNANKNLKLIFLPPYSPNLNPIEKYWATLKKNLKKITKNNKSLEESIYELFLVRLLYNHSRHHRTCHSPFIKSCCNIYIRCLFRIFTYIRYFIYCHTVLS